MATLTFWGAAGTVTGSKYLIESGGKRILLDCGLFQGLKELRERNWQEPPFEPGSLDAIVLTHAHLDHTGYLPKLVKQGYHGPVYCSHGTAELLKILLPDSAHLQEEDAGFRNRHHLTRHQPALPLYTQHDVQAALHLLAPVADAPGRVPLAKGIHAQFFNAGHILGARFVLLTCDDGKDDSTQAIRILFSGDIGRYGRPLLYDPDVPPACDILVVESTYGDRLHDTTDVKVDLAKIINAAAQRRKAILIPAFAVGRTQEILTLLRELEDEGRIPCLPVIADSPMAAAATRTYQLLSDELASDPLSLPIKNRHPLPTHALRTASSRHESKRIQQEEGAHIIVSSAGMMTGGRVLHHARRILPDPDATLIIVGFQAAGTTGRRILDGERTVKIFKEPFPVRCHVERIEGFSAHADWQGVLRWMSGLPNRPRQIYVTHGEPDAATAMRGHIADRFGWTAQIPKYGDHMELYASTA